MTDLYNMLEFSHMNGVKQFYSNRTVCSHLTPSVSEDNFEYRYWQKRLLYYFLSKKKRVRKPFFLTSASQASLFLRANVFALPSFMVEGRIYLVII